MDDLAKIIGDRRRALGLSIGRLAVLADVSKSTVSRWEAGRTLPAMAELEKVLVALNADAALRTSALEAITAPRAVRTLRHLGRPAHGGDLIRTLRLRAGITQADAASAAGVTRSSLSGWERGESWPDAEKLHRLAFALGASAEELEALSDPGLRLGGREPDDMTTLHAAANDIIADDVHRAPYDDLPYLSLDARLRSSPDPEAAVLLGTMRAWYASRLSFRKRYAEAWRYALAVRHGTSGADRSAMLHAGVIAAWVGVMDGRTTPVGALGFLDRLLPRASGRPEFQAWILADAAALHRLAGDRDAADELSRRALREAEECGPSEIRSRRTDRVRFLLSIGRPHEAAALVDGPVRELPRPRTLDELLRAEVALRTRDIGRARSYLDALEARLITHRETADFRPEIVRLRTLSRAFD